MRINRICLSFAEAEKLKIVSACHTLTQMLHRLRQDEAQPLMDKFRRCIRSWLSLFEIPIKFRDWKIIVDVGTNQGITCVCRTVFDAHFTGSKELKENLIHQSPTDCYLC